MNFSDRFDNDGFNQQIDNSVDYIPPPHIFSDDSDFDQQSEYSFSEQGNNFNYLLDGPLISPGLYYNNSVLPTPDYNNSALPTPYYNNSALPTPTPYYNNSASPTPTLYYNNSALPTPTPYYNNSASPTPDDSQHDDNFNYDEHICNGTTIDNIFKLNLNQLDMYELYTLGKYKQLEYLFVDNAMKTFTKFKDTVENEANIINDIFCLCTKLDTTKTIYVQSIPLQINEEKTYTIKKFNNGVMTDVNEKIILKETDIVYIEYNQGDFGHFGVFSLRRSPYNNELRLFFYDSMIRTNNHETIHYNAIVYCKLQQENVTLFLESWYFNTFYSYFIEAFTRDDGIYVEIDFPHDFSIYSMEMTGGSFNVENPLIIDSSNNILKNIKKYILGPDNQNQFCFIWSIFYIFIIYYSNKSFIDIIQEIKKKDIVPVFIIKRFILLVLFKLGIKRKIAFSKTTVQKEKTVYFKDQINVIEKTKVFDKYFNYVLCNSAKYSEIYKDECDQFELYNVLTNSEKLDKIENVSVEDIKTALELVIPSENNFKPITQENSATTIDLCNILGIDAKLFNKLINKIETHIDRSSHKFIQYLEERSSEILKRKNAKNFILSPDNLDLGKELVYVETPKQKIKRKAKEANEAKKAIKKQEQEKLPKKIYNTRNNKPLAKQHRQ